MEMAAGAPLSLRYHSDQLSLKVSATLQEFYQTGEFCDIVLTVGSAKIRAHRVVLASFSPYFRDLFQQPTSKQCSEITLRSHLEEDAVCQLINFCYSSDITVDSKSADKILTAANFLQVKEVEKLCITFLVAQQALKPEGLAAGAHAQTNSPQLTLNHTETTGKESKKDNSHELVCADTSGIGSTQTSPRHSSRPSSVQSRNDSGTVQPPEDPEELDLIEVKKEREDNSGYNPTSSAGSSRTDYETLRSSLSSFPGLLYSPTSLTHPLLSPTQPFGASHHHLLMKALSQKQTSPTDFKDMASLYGNQGLFNHFKEESFHTSSEGSPVAGMPQMHQCHVCQLIFTSLSSLKSHMNEHRDVLTVPLASPYKMMSPVQKFARQTSTNQSKEKDSDDVMISDGSNMCGTCGKCFRDPQSLKFHRYNHVLRYQCNFCGKRFSRSWNLHRHRKTHYRQHGNGIDASISVIDVDNDKSDASSYLNESMSKFSFSMDKTENQDEVIDMTTTRNDLYPCRMVLPTATSTYGEINVDDEASKNGCEEDKTDGRMETEPYMQDKPDKIVAGNVEERSKEAEEQTEPK